MRNPTQMKQIKAFNLIEPTRTNQPNRIKSNEPTQTKQLKPRIWTIKPKRAHSNNPIQTN